MEGKKNIAVRFPKNKAHRSMICERRPRHGSLAERVSPAEPCDLPPTAILSAWLRRKPPILEFSGALNQCIFYDVQQSEALADCCGEYLSIRLITLTE